MRFLSIRNSPNSIKSPAPRKLEAGDRLLQDEAAGSNCIGLNASDDDQCRSCASQGDNRVVSKVSGSGRDLQLPEGQAEQPDLVFTHLEVHNPVTAFSGSYKLIAVPSA